METNSVISLKEQDSCDRDEVKDTVDKESEKLSVGVEVKDTVDKESEKLSVDENIKETEVLRFQPSETMSVPSEYKSLSQDEVISSYLDVDKDIWLYMTTTQKYSLALDKVKANCNIQIGLEDADGHLCLTGINMEEIEKAQIETERLIEHCCQTVKTVILPLQHPDVYNNIIELVKSNDLPNAIVTAANDIVKVTGTDIEVKNCIGMLQETLGLVTFNDGHMPNSELNDASGQSLSKLVNSMQDSTEQVVCDEMLGERIPLDAGVVTFNDGHMPKSQLNDASGQSLRNVNLMLQDSTGVACDEMLREKIALDAPKLQLWRQDLINRKVIADENDEDLYGEMVEIDQHRWFYMQKNDSYSSIIKQIKNDMNIKLEEKIIEGPQDHIDVHLVVTGKADEVAKALKVALEVTNRCKSLSKTITVPCPDNKIFTKICKLLKSINKSSCYVSASSETVFVTGNNEEIADCIERLQKLGLIYEFTQNKQCDEEEQVSEDVSIKHSVVGESQQAETEAKISRRIDMSLEQEGLNAEERAHQNEAAAGKTDETDVTNSEKHFAELPVPIEEQLWWYIEERRRDQLKDLRETFEMTIASYPGLTGYVTITLETESAIMLDCGRDALVQLLEQLRATVISVTIDTNAQELPNELKDLLKQMSNGTDAIIHCSGGHICIIGPSQDTTTCQQKIAAFMQQVAAQAGQATDDPALQARLGRGRGRLEHQGFPTSLMPGIVQGNEHPRQDALRFPNPDSDIRSRGMTRGLSDMPQNQSETINASVVGERMVTGRPDLSLGANRNPMMSSGFQSGMDGSSMFEDDDDDEENEEKQRVSQLWMGASNREIKDNPKSISEYSHGENTEQLSSVLRKEDDSPLDFNGKSVKSHTESLAKLTNKENVNKEFVSNLTTNRVKFSDDNEEHVKGKINNSVDNHDDCVTTENVSSQNESCSVCQIEPHENKSGRKCNHSFCVSCVQTYFTNGETQCPVCGVHESIKAVPTQPTNGQMIVTYENSFKLPGFQASRGTIVVVYIFPAGTQMVDMPTPGKAYSGLTQTAFFPLSSEGSKIVDLLQRAFDQRYVFAIQSNVNSPVDIITWNKILHKTNVFGGPQMCGYPDPVYLKRVTSELEALGFI